MKHNGKKHLQIGGGLLMLFVLWTWLVQTMDVRPVGPQGTEVGFSSLNLWVHEVTGVHMWLYHITDWMGLVPVFVCVMFGGLGAVQLVRRRSLLRVDIDILLLGLYYILVIGCYLAFEMMPVNYRPILIEGRLEASYPSSTTLLVLSVMPTLIFQMQRRVKSGLVKKGTAAGVGVFVVFMVLGRLLSGVHWLTDIVGSILFSVGVFCIYTAAVLLCRKEK